MPILHLSLDDTSNVLNAPFVLSKDIRTPQLTLKHYSFTTDTALTIPVIYLHFDVLYQKVNLVADGPRLMLPVGYADKVVHASPGITFGVRSSYIPNVIHMNVFSDAHADTLLSSGAWKLNLYFEYEDVL